MTSCTESLQVAVGGNKCTGYIRLLAKKVKWEGEYATCKMCTSQN